MNAGTVVAIGIGAYLIYRWKQTGGNVSAGTLPEAGELLDRMFFKNQRQNERWEPRSGGHDPFAVWAGGSGGGSPNSRGYWTSLSHFYWPKK